MKYLLVFFLYLFVSNIAFAQTSDIQVSSALEAFHSAIQSFIISSTSSSMALEAPVMPQVARELSIRDKVALAFPDEPRMMDIIECESQFNQLNSRGKVLKSPTSDYGVMQINKIHVKEAKRLGLDIFTSVDDNIKMGRIIYEQQGLDAWTCNRKV